MASDKARFGTLKAAVDADLSDRRDWFARAEKSRTERFKRQNTAKPVYAMRDMGEDRARFRDSALADSQTMVDVWEVYYETADLGRRVCCFCPQFPDLVLSDRPWTWIALIGAESEPPAREDSMTQTLGPESVKAFMLWIFNTVDTELARKIQGQGGWRQVKGFA